MMDLMWLAVLVITFFVLSRVGAQPPAASRNWVERKPPDGNKFTSRNNHATCQFKGRIWLSGGRSQVHPIYNLKSSVKENDVWYSDNGERWVQVKNFTGDFYKQNDDVLQAGIRLYAPWYQRFGHSMDTVYTDQDKEVMLLMGGFAPGPIDDMWVTEDGFEWSYGVFSQESDTWSARAWHRTAWMNSTRTLFMMGGTPLNNEVWRLDKVERKDRAPITATRSMYLDYHYHMTWKLLSRNGAADWSPRVGFGLFSQYYRDSDDYRDAQERLVLVAGYGGWPRPSEYSEYTNSNGSARTFAGYQALDDSWESYDGITWTLLGSTSECENPPCDCKKGDCMGRRAWFGFATFAHHEDPRIDPSASAQLENPRMWIFGGGNIGYVDDMKKSIDLMDGRSDAYWSRNGKDWYRINYMEGGGTSVTEFFSSQEWTETQVDGQVKFLGLWGHTVQMFRATLEPVLDAMFLIAGDMTGSGGTRQATFQSLVGMFCDMGGNICNGHGMCGPSAWDSTIEGTQISGRGSHVFTFRYEGCVCDPLPFEGIVYSGEYCDVETVQVTDDGGGDDGSGGLLLIIAIVAGIAISLGIMYTIMNRN